MATFAQEKILRAHLELIAEGGDYAGYFTQGTNADGDPSAWFLTNDSDKDAAQALLDARVASLTDIGSENQVAKAPSDFDGYTPSTLMIPSGVDYRTWFR